MALISNETVNEIRKKTDIVEVISKYLPLTKRGKNYFGVCPFHDDHSPSMSVSPEKQIYTCFSCGATGNVFTFVSEYENIGFYDAVRLLGERLGYKIGSSNVLRDDNHKSYEIYELATKYYQNNLNSALGKNAINYLAKRQIDRETIKKFEIGLALSQSSLTNILVNKKVPMSELVALGLTSEYGNDLFLNRIMFPLHDLSGHVVAFSGRIYNTKDSSKYINTKETKIFKKGNILYNYHRVRPHLKKADYVIIMEGFMDVIRASTIGVDNCLATMGTAFTKEQALVVNKLTNNIILCFDGDKAGEDATVSAIKLLEEMNITPKIIRLEEDLDPDEYILAKGKDAFLNKIDKAISVIEFKMELLKKSKNLTDIEDISSYIDSSVKELTKLNDEVMVELTLKKIASEYDVGYDTLKNKYETYKNNITKKEDKIIKKVHPKLNVYDKASRNLIYYMLKDSSIINKVEHEVAFFPNDNLRYLFNEIIYYYHKYGVLEIADFITYLSDHKELVNILYEIINMDIKDGYTNEEIDDYIKVLNDYIKKRKIKELETRLKQEIDPIKQAEILEDIMKIRGVKQ